MFSVYSFIHRARIFLIIGSSSSMLGCANVENAEIQEEVEVPPYSQTKKSKKVPAVYKVSANKKCNWKDEHVEALICYIKDYRTLCDFNGIEFEVPWVKLFLGEFSPDMVTELPTCKPKIQ